MTKSRYIIFRMYVVFLLIVAGFSYIGYKLYDVQIVRHEELLEKARKRYTTQLVEQGERGEIYDNDGRLLVGNYPTVKIVCDPSLIATEADCRILASWFAKRIPDVNEFKIFSRMMNKTIEVKHEDGTVETKPRKYALIAEVDLEQGDFIKAEISKLADPDLSRFKEANLRKLSEKEREVMREMKKQAQEDAKKYKTISFRSHYRRNYPKKTLLANILGFTNKDDEDFIAIQGVERTLNEQMTDQPGKMVYERTRTGKHVTYANDFYEPAQDGYDVFLTIKEPIQVIVEEEIDKLMERVKPNAAMITLVDPFTGDILAAAQRPTFNPNETESRTQDAIVNRLSEFAFEPGSIMKSFVISYALDRGFVTPNTPVDCERSAWFYAGKLLGDTHYLGTVPVSEIIRQSSNIGTAKVAVQMGKTELNNALRMFGFGERTNVQLKPESRGMFHPLNQWSNLSVARLCIGQGIAVTPLQLARAYSMIANGGHMLDLRLVDRLERGTDIVKMPYVYSEESVFKNKDTAKKITDMLRSVTEPGGTGTTAAVPGFYVAGKTGTAQKAVKGGYAAGKIYFSSFAGFVPAYNPKFVLVVTCDEPHWDQNRNGGPVSGPTFSAIADRVLRYMNVSPDLPEEQWLAERKEIQREYRESRLKADAKLAEERQKKAAETAAKSRASTTTKKTTTTSSQRITSTRTAATAARSASSSKTTPARTTTTAAVKRTTSSTKTRN